MIELFTPMHEINYSPMTKKLFKYIITNMQTLLNELIVDEYIVAIHTDKTKR